MAKIIYAVAGEGFGHSSRSHMIGQKLIDAGHDVLFVGSNKSLQYLSIYFPDRVKEVFGLTFEYDRTGVKAFKTVWRNIKHSFKGFPTNYRLYRQHYKNFKPDLVISDFEPFSAWWALRHRVPFVSIDHEHVLTDCKLDFKWKDWFPRFNSWLITKLYYMGAKNYIILNFFDTPLKHKKAALTPPLVRAAVSKITPSIGDYIVYYTTIGQGKEEVQKIFSKFPDQKFIIYGFNENSQQENCTYKERSTEGFLNDMANSQAVIASAGFSLISECLYYRKKTLLIPVTGQYEQMTNAHYIEKLGLGVAATELSEDILKKFIEETHKPMPEDDRILWPNNERVFEILQEQFSKLKNPININ